MPASLFPGIIFIPIAALAMICVVIGLTRRTEEVRTAARRDVQLALLQKFSSGEELTRFLATEEGKQLVDKLSIDTGGSDSDPRKKTVDALTGAFVLIFLGGGLCLLAAKVSGFLVPGVILLAIGLGLLVAAAITHRVSKKLGLIPTANPK